MSEWHGYAAECGYRWAGDDIQSRLAWVECSSCFLDVVNHWPTEYRLLSSWLELGCPTLAVVVSEVNNRWAFIYSPVPCHRHAGNPKS